MHTHTHTRACMCTQSISCVQLFATLWALACQVPLSMEFPRQEHWSGSPFLSPGNLPDPGIKNASPLSPALVCGLFTNSVTWEAHTYNIYNVWICMKGLSKTMPFELIPKQIYKGSKVNHVTSLGEDLKDRRSRWTKGTQWNTVSIFKEEQTILWLSWVGRETGLEDQVREPCINSTLLHQFSSVAQSCPTLCDPMDCSSPGFPVHHQLMELAKTHGH